MLPDRFDVVYNKVSTPVIFITDNETAHKALDKLIADKGLMGADTETAALPKYQGIDPRAALDPKKSRIRLIQVCTGKGVAVFDMFSIKQTDELKAKVKKLFETRPSVFHNLQFDLKFLRTWYGVDDAPMECSCIMSRMILHHLYYFSKSASLGNMAEALFGEYVNKSAGGTDWSKPLSFEQVKYSAMDAILVKRIYDTLEPKMKTLKMWNCYKLYVQAQHGLVDMEINGMAFNKRYHMENVVKWREELVQATAELKEATGLEAITDAKVAGYLERTLAPALLDIWPRTDNEKSPKLKTDAHTLADFDYLDICKPFAKYQRLKKLCSSFGANLVKMISAETGRLHPSYMLCGARTGRLSCSSPNLQQCYSRDTEVLTKRGWVRIDSLQDADKVAQWNKDLSIDFVKPSAYFRYNDVDTLIHISTTQIDLLVTPNHRCLVQDRKSKKFSDVKAEDFPSDRMHYHAGNYVGGTECSLNPDWIRLMVAVQADGSFHDSGICIGLTRHRKIERLEALLTRLGARYSKSKRKATKEYRYRIKQSSLVDSLYNYLGKDKTFKWDILNYSRNLLDVFINEVRYWDGLTTRETDEYCSIIEANADIVQAVYALSNRRAYKYEASHKLEHSIPYRVSVPNRNYSITTNAGMEQVNYNDSVYCVEVPSSYLLVRRNNKISVSGNSPRDPKFRETFTAREGFVLVGADLSQIEVRYIAEMSQDEEMLTAYEQGLDIYAYTAAKLNDKDIKDVTKKERQQAKALVLGLNYGLGPKKFSHYAKKSYSVDISQEEAKKAVEAYREIYHGLRNWQLEQVQNCIRNNYIVRTKLGKTRKLTNDTFYGSCMNHPIQGGSCEVLLLAIVKLRKLIKGKARLIATIHDEIIVECRPEKAEEVKGILEKAMYDAYQEHMPNNRTSRGIVDALIGNNWAELKD